MRNNVADAHQFLGIRAEINGDRKGIVMKTKSNVSYVQEGVRLLVPALEEYIAQEMVPVHKNDTWEEIVEVLGAKDLSDSGSFEQRVRQLDLAACLSPSSSATSGEMESLRRRMVSRARQASSSLRSLPPK